MRALDTHEHDWHYAIVFTNLITKTMVTDFNDENFDNNIALKILKMMMILSVGKSKNNSWCYLLQATFQKSCCDLKNEAELRREW